MKQFKKLALCLLAAVLALGMFAACGRTPLDVTVDDAKKAEVVSVLNQYLAANGKPAMTADAKMEKAAAGGLEPSVAYKQGVFHDKVDYALEVMGKSGLSQSELETIYNEGRYMGFTLPVSKFNDANILTKTKQKFPKKVSVTKYGLSVGVYDDTVYVCMFME